MGTGAAAEKRANDFLFFVLEPIFPLVFMAAATTFCVLMEFGKGNLFLSLWNCGSGTYLLLFFALGNKKRSFNSLIV